MLQKQIQLEIFEQDRRIKTREKNQINSAAESIQFKFPTQLCIKIACLIIIIVISFTLGVERGRVISRNEIASRFLADGKTQEIIKDVSIEKENKQKLPIAAEKLEKKAKDDKTIIDEKPTGTGYVIQLVTYKKNSSYIEKEIAKLQKNGYNTLIFTKGEYTEICAGKFSNKKEAQDNFKKLQHIYKDCRIRKI